MALGRHARGRRRHLPQPAAVSGCACQAEFARLSELCQRGLRRFDPRRAVRGAAERGHDRLNARGLKEGVAVAVQKLLAHRIEIPSYDEHRLSSGLA